MPDQDIDVDALVESIEAPAQERAMTSDEPAAPAEPEQWAAPDWLEFEHNGQKIRPDSLDKVKTWLSQGHNYSQRAATLNAKEREWQTKLQEAETYKSKYHPVDEYARKNPEWWEHMERGYAEKMKNPQGLSPELAPLAEKLGQVESFIGQIQQEKLLQEQKAEDQQLDQEIAAIRKEFPTIDLNAIDDSGLTLEKRILDYAGEKRIPDFTAAFRNYLYPQLIELAKTEALKSVAKDQESRARKGILGTTQTPTKAVQRADNVRGKSYDQLMAEAKAEFGIA